MIHFIHVVGFIHVILQFIPNSFTSFITFLLFLSLRSFHSFQFFSSFSSFSSFPSIFSFPFLSFHVISFHFDSFRFSSFLQSCETVQSSMSKFSLACQDPIFSTKGSLLCHFGWQVISHRESLARMTRTRTCRMQLGIWLKICGLKKGTRSCFLAADCVSCGL